MKYKGSVAPESYALLCLCAGQVTWVKLHDTKVDNLKLSDGKKLTVKSGTQIMDRCWRHLREHLRDTPRKPENLIVTGRIRSAVGAVAVLEPQ